MKKQALAILLASALLSGCATQADTSIAAPSSSAQPVVAMGRYVEKDITFTAEQRYDYTSRASMNIGTDGKIVVHVRGGLCKAYINENGKWHDKGYTDEEMLKPVAQKYLGKEVISFSSEENAKPFITQHLNLGDELVGPDGYIFTTGAYYYTENYSRNGGKVPGKDKIEQLIVSYNGTDARYYTIPEYNEKVNIANGEDVIPSRFGRISRQNVMIIRREKEDIFYDLSVEGGKKLGTLANTLESEETSLNYPDLVAIIDDTVLVATTKAAAIYTLSTGEQLAQVALEGIQKVCEGVDGAFYALSKEGIWRILPNGGIVQRVVDGSTCSFSAPAFKAYDFVQGSDGSFYIMALNNDANKLLKYEFSQTTPLEREKTLHLWSLRDNPTIREAAAEFMRQNPEVKVYVEIVPQEMSVKKATEGLTAALLAGTGPDIIFTDGIALALLDEQGLLATIPTGVDLQAYDKRLLPIGQVNNRQVAIGTKLFYAVDKEYIVGNKLSAPSSLEALLARIKANTQAIEQMRKAAGATAFITPQLRYFNREDAFNAVYTAASAAIWQNETNKAAAQVALELMGEIDAKFIYSDEDYNISPKETFNVVTRSDIAQNQICAVGVNGKAGVIISRIIAYSANTQNADLCIAFINTTLSDYVQAANISDGVAAIQAVKITSYDNNSNLVTQNMLALDCLVRQNTGELVELAPDAVQIGTANYIRDDAFKAIAYDYLDKKINLDEALAKISEL